MMRVAIICEGSSDYPVLRRIVESALGGEDVAFSEIQPDFDALRAKQSGTPGPGWHGVRKYLGITPALAVAATRHDIVVVQIDADVRRSRELAGRLRPVGDGEEELLPLCEHVRSWIQPPVPPAVVVTLPREATEAWLLAIHTRLKSVETIQDPANELVDAGLVSSTSNGRPDKERPRFAELAQPLDRLLADKKQLGRAVPELRRFVEKVQRRARGVRAQRKSAAHEG